MLLLTRRTEDEFMRLRDVQKESAPQHLHASCFFALLCVCMIPEEEPYGVHHLSCNGSVDLLATPVLNTSAI